VPEVVEANNPNAGAFACALEAPSYDVPIDRPTGRGVGEYEVVVPTDTDESRSSWRKVRGQPRRSLGPEIGPEALARVRQAAVGQAGQADVHA
jgi:hypothetical protein